MQEAITWTNVDLDPCRFMASLGHNELIILMMNIPAEKKVNTMAIDALALCFDNSGTSNILNETHIEFIVYLFLLRKLEYLLLNRTSPWQQMIWILASISIMIMVLSIQYKQVLVFHEAGFQLPVLS